MHKIIVMSKDEAIKHSYHKNIDDCIMISIQDTSQNNVKFNRNPKINAILRLFFSDIEYEIESGIMMSKNDAKTLKDFIDLWKEKVGTIIIHCQAGISRSAGVAASIEKYLNGEMMELEDIWNNHKYSPNGCCYKICCKAFGFDVSEDDIKRLKYLNNKAHSDWFELEENREFKEQIEKMFN
jgi:predicted protein tyrosine phosphatase